MKLKILFCLLFASSVSYGGTLLKLLPGNKSLKNQQAVNIQKANDGNEIQVKFHLPFAELEETKNVNGLFKTFKFPSLSLINEAGAPMLPFHAIIVEGKSKDIAIEVEKRFSITFGQFNPLPAPKMPCRCDEDQKGPKFVIKQKLFEKFSNMGSKSVHFEIEDLGDFRGRPLSRVVFYPFSYNKLAKTLVLFPDLTFKIGHKKGKEIKTVENLVTSDQSSSEKPRYLILTPSHLAGALNSFVEWKTSLGMDVDVYTLEDIGQSFSDIKKFIHKLYQNPETKFEYALLVGHEKLMPTEYVPTSADKNTPSDLHYFTMGGGADKIPDVFYGRLVAHNAEEVMLQTMKTIEYEKERLDNGPRVLGGVGIASNEGSNPSDVEYLKQFEGFFGSSVQFKDFLQENTNSIPSNINEAISRGASWMMYIGHGSGTSWVSLSNYGSYENKHVSQLPIVYEKPVIIDVSCQNGRFLYDQSIGGYLGERWMNGSHPSGPPIGAVAYYGGSVNISWHPPAIMAVGISKHLNQDKLNHLGEALLAGQMHLYNNHSSKKEVEENLTWYHLFGDPSLTIRYKQ